jgi:hypothetical protein
MDPLQTLTTDAKGVAMLLGLPFEQQFHTRRRRLEKNGFPRPLPMTPLRWSIFAVEQWIRANGAPTQCPSTLDAALLPERDPTIVRLENFRAGRVA